MMGRMLAVLLAQNTARHQDNLHEESHHMQIFISQKIQTNDLERVEATTGDNVVLSTTATVNWLIADVALAARMAAETMTQTKS